MKPVSANGFTGFLLNTFDGGFVFRVYDDEGYNDYKIKHSDLYIKIIDADAFFYDAEILDHSPETLGLDNDK
jgi:hypothetical protein